MFAYEKMVPMCCMCGSQCMYVYEKMVPMCFVCGSQCMYVYEKMVPMCCMCAGGSAVHCACVCMKTWRSCVVFQEYYASLSMKRW